MLALTKKTEYALIAMTHLAKLEGERIVSAREMSQTFGVSAALLMNVMKELAVAGYVDSVRGARGGYRLAVRPDAVNLADLVAAIEGPVSQTECRLHRADDRHECTTERMACCPVADPVHRVHRKLNDFLRKLTLADILEPSPVASDAR